MSFTLSIENAPGGSHYWWAEYSLTYSGWLDVNVAWDCPYGAYGATDLRILVVDSDYNPLHDKSGLGPIYDDRAYVYDCSTQQLSEVPAATYHLDVFVPSWAYGGYVSPGSGDYPANTTVILTAHSLSGYQFVNWGGDASGTSPIYNLYIDNDKYVEAYFEEVLVPEFAGTISRKELEYDSAQASIPVYDISQDERGLVHIWGRNDMSSAQQMGISWIVYDPDWLVVEEYSDWEDWPYTGAGGDHHFIGGRFDLDKPGSWTINIALFMNPSDPETVDTYYGALCTVAAAVPEPEFRGFGVTEYVTV